MKQNKYIATLIILSVLIFPFGAPEVHAATDVSTHSTLPTGLVSYWELEEASGTRVDSAASNDLTENNSVGTETGKQGEAAFLDSANSEWLSITDASQSGLDTGSSDVSISVWINLDSWDVGISPFFSKNYYTNGRRGTSWEIHGTASANTQFRFYISTTGSNAYSLVVTDTSVGLNDWYHIVMTYDASAGAVEVFVNGSSVGTASNASATSIYDNGEPWEMGRNSQFSRDIDGALDEFGIWTKILSSGEIADLYNSGAGIPYLAAGGENTAVKETAIFGNTFISGNTANE